MFFPQGQYGGTEGNNTGGVRYHEGVVDSAVERNGVKYFRYDLEIDLFDLVNSISVSFK